MILSKKYGYPPSIILKESSEIASERDEDVLAIQEVYMVCSKKYAPDLLNEISISCYN
jgi:hypothetical protein